MIIKISNNLGMNRTEWYLEVSIGISNSIIRIFWKPGMKIIICIQTMQWLIEKINGVFGKQALTSTIFVSQTENDYISKFKTSESLSQSYEPDLFVD